MLGLFPNMHASLVTPTRCVRPPPSRHLTRTPRRSAPHDCTLTACETKDKGKDKEEGDVLGNSSNDVLGTF